jgi:hypothetical protein
MNVETMIEEKLLIETLRRQVTALEEHVKTLQEMLQVKNESIAYLRMTVDLDDRIIEMQKNFLTPSLN